MSKAPLLTDRAALIRNRTRALAPGAPFLHDIAAEELQDRLAMVKKSFNAPGVVTGHADFWGDALGAGWVVSPDDERISLAQGAHDLVVHTMALHWANDPVGQLIQCLRALKPDGLFLAVMFGGQTLHELRAALAQAESEISGGLSPRVAPMGEIRDLGGLLQGAGFALPVADRLVLKASYADLLALMRELRAMGEGNALDQRMRRFAPRRLFQRAEEIYRTAYEQDDGRLPATFELVFLQGWAPDESQPKPLRPGSAQARLADALGADEFKIED